MLRKLMIQLSNFNKAVVLQTICAKHLGMYLDGQVSFNHHIRKKIAKATKNLKSKQHSSKAVNDYHS